MKKRKTAKGFSKSKNTLLVIALIVTAGILMISLLRTPFSVNAKDKVTITEYSVLDSNSTPFFITSGSDGNLWFTEFNGNRIGRITPRGRITEFIVPTANSTPHGIISGPDGNIWFTEEAGNKIGRITTTGEITEFIIPTDNSTPGGITSGPDGNLWFTESNANKIARITTTGEITEFVVSPGSTPISISSGSDGNIWFTEFETNKIGRITPVGVITEFTVPTANSTPHGITPGHDGNLWFTEEASNKIGRITPSGLITEFTTPTIDSRPVDIVSGADGKLWFTEEVGNKIGQITLAGMITEFMVPTEDSLPYGITAGPDGNIWFTENNGRIGRVNLSPHKGPDRDFALLSPFNNGVTWTVSQGYFNNRNQSKDGCHIGIGPDHCRNQLFGLDMVPDQQDDTAILAPGDGKVAFTGKLEDEDCIGLRITLDNGLNLNVCHFATFNVSQGDRIIRGKVLGTRSTPHVHLSLDDRYRIGTLCPGPDRCFLPVPFDEQHTIEGMSFNPNPNGETVLLPYSLCDERKVDCQFEVGFQQYQGTSGTSTNVAIP